MRALRSIRGWLFGDADHRSDAAPSPGPVGAATAGEAADPPSVAPLDERPPPAAAAPVVAERQERAAERLLEDERLRGDLADEEFQPLLDWALAASDALAARTAGLSDDEAGETVDAGVGQIRDLVRAAGGAVSAMLDGGSDARNAELVHLTELVAPPLVPEAAVAEARARLAAALEPIARDPEKSGPDLAAALAEALQALVHTTVDKDGSVA